MMPKSMLVPLNQMIAHSDYRKMPKSSTELLRAIGCSAMHTLDDPVCWGLFHLRTHLRQHVIG